MGWDLSMIHYRFGNWAGPSGTGTGSGLQKDPILLGMCLAE